jgi:hypothetical protein
MFEYFRPPDERIDRLPVSPFPPHYISTFSGCENLLLHYIDEGPPLAEKDLRRWSEASPWHGMGKRGDLSFEQR